MNVLKWHRTVHFNTAEVVNCYEHFIIIFKKTMSPLTMVLSVEPHYEPRGRLILHHKV